MSEPTPTARPRYPGLRIAFAGLTALLVVVALALAWLLGTESGLRAGATLVARASADAVRLEGVGGRLISGFSVVRVNVDLPTLRVAARDLNVRWDATALLDGRVHVSLLELGELALSAAPGDTGSAPPALPPPLALPVELMLERLAIGQFSMLPWQDAAAPAALQATLRAQAQVEAALFRGPLHRQRER